MESKEIRENMKVWDVIQEYPQTFEVFQKYGCPDMRSGVFALSARIMNVRWAARMHKISVEDLLRDLNMVAKQPPGEIGKNSAA
jgi:hypothetical protein